MNLLLIFDKNFTINKTKLSDFFKQKAFQYIDITIHEKNIKLKERFISNPSSFNKIKNSFDNIKYYDKVFIFTDKQYEDNYFFHTQENLVICSFYGWKYFTNLSKSNGIIYFIVDVLALEIDPSFRHQKITGCIYDFLWDKTGIDTGMRNSIFCESCQTRLNKTLVDEKKSFFKELEILMDELSISSTKNRDILLENNEEITFSASDINITNETILVSNLINKLNSDTIILDKNTEFWDNKQMSRFIESILLKLPLPALYFDVSNPKKWQIVDGANRLNSLQKFIIEQNFNLTNLEFLKKLNGKSYQQLDGVYKRVIDETAMITYQVGVQTPKAVRDSIVNRINNKRGIK